MIPSPTMLFLMLALLAAGTFKPLRLAIGAALLVLGVACLIPGVIT